MLNYEPELRKQWDDLDFDPVGLWRHLLRYDYDEAAAGLLVDLFRELIHSECPHLKTDEVMADGYSMSSHLVALYRERLMEILGDEHGTVLKEWRRKLHLSHEELHDECYCFAVNTGIELRKREGEEREKRAKKDYDDMKNWLDENPPE
jgi:hypothetical protein